jgi:hypothetical protein
MNEEGRQMAKTKIASETIESKNKAFVPEAFDTLFNQRDYEAAERFWSPNYIQHSNSTDFRPNSGGSQHG